MFEAKRIAKAMNLRWDAKVGPATIATIISGLMVLGGLGVTWGSTTSKIDAAALLASEAKSAAKEVSDGSVQRDHRIAMQAERLGKIETSIQFIVPALQRIESKIDARP